MSNKNDTEHSKADIDHISAVQVQHADWLMNCANVVGLAIGLAKVNDVYTDQMALVVLVSQKLPLDQLAPEDVIPHELDGVRVDVQETGIFTAF